jgi:hypothetical protein
MHSLPDLHMKSKKSEISSNLNMQQGSGEQTSDKLSGDYKDSELEELLKESQPINNDDNPIEFNEQKRKKMGDQIHDSFLHPSFVKTSKIVLEPQTKKKNTVKVIKKDTNLKGKNIKHKFKFA